MSAVKVNRAWVAKAAKQPLAALIARHARYKRHECGYACHTVVKANDYIFTRYAPR
jgi:hypothetical protein